MKSLLKEIAQRWIIGNPVKVGQKFQGQGITKDNCYLLGCYAGPEKGVEYLLHEMAHLSEREEEKIVERPSFGWGFSHGKYWEVATHILEDFRHKFIPDLFNYINLIDKTEEVTQSLKKISDIKYDFKVFLNNNPEIANFLDEPLYLTGDDRSLLTTWNSWTLGVIVPRVFKITPPFIGVKPQVIFDSMKSADWINNGRGEIKAEVIIKKDKPKTEDENLWSGNLPYEPLSPLYQNQITK